MANRSLRAGIVGCGRVAGHHARFIQAHPGAEVAAVADVDEDTARQFAAQHRVGAVFGSLEEMLDEVKLDVLHVLTPPDLHVAQALAAVDRGVHVLVEKPVALNYKDAERLFAHASRRAVLVCPDFIQLFHPHVQEAWGLIRTGGLGRIVHCDCYMSIDPDVELGDLRESVSPHWSFELPGGVLHNYITHALYLALYWIGGARLVRATPRVFGSQPQGLTDHIDLEVTGETATAHVTLSLVTRPASYVLKVYCEGGIIQIDVDRLTLVVERPSMLPRTIGRLSGSVSQSWQLAGCSVGNIVNRVRGKLVPYYGLRDLIGLFYQRIREGGASPISVDLALAVSRVEQAAIAQAGKVHVDLAPRPCRQTNIRRSERVLVTGASGYLGREVVRCLVTHGYPVRALVRPLSHITELEELGVEVCFGDLRHREAVLGAAKDVDIVVHLGAAPRGGAEFMRATAVLGTANVAAAAETAGVRQVVYLSSMSVYDYLTLRDGDVLGPESPLEPAPQMRGQYSQAKREAEDIALEHLRRGRPAWTILRPSVFFGNGRDPKALIGFSWRRWLFCAGRPRRRLLLVHVKDVASAILLAMENNRARGQIYTVSHPETVPLGEYVRTCVRKGGRGGLRVVYVPYTIAYGAMLVVRGFGRLSGWSPGISPQRLAALYRDVVVDSSPIRQDLNWAPTNGLLAELQAEAEAFKNEKARGYRANGSANRADCAG